MPSLKNVLSMRFVPEQTQCGLSVLRICAGLNLFLHHGWEKNPTHWTQFMAHFPDPIGIRISANRQFSVSSWRILSSGPARTARPFSPKA